MKGCSSSIAVKTRYPEPRSVELEGRWYPLVTSILYYSDINDGSSFYLIELGGFVGVLTVFTVFTGFRRFLHVFVGFATF